MPTFHVRCVRWAAASGGELHEQGGDGGGGVAGGVGAVGATGKSVSVSVLTVRSSDSGGGHGCRGGGDGSHRGSPAAPRRSFVSWAPTVALAPKGGGGGGGGGGEPKAAPPANAPDPIRAAEPGDLVQDWRETEGAAAGGVGCRESDSDIHPAPLPAGPSAAPPAAGPVESALPSAAAAQVERLPGGWSRFALLSRAGDYDAGPAGATDRPPDDVGPAARPGAGETAAGGAAPAALFSAVALLAGVPQPRRAAAFLPRRTATRSAALAPWPGPSRGGAPPRGDGPLPPGGRLMDLVARVAQPRLRWGAGVCLGTGRRAAGGGGRGGPGAASASWRVARARAGATALLMRGTLSHGVQAAVRGWIATRFVKNPLRAAGKAAACYRGDVSRLLDVCRARIAFRSVGELAACVRAVAASAPAVRVVRVRNLLRAGEDAWATAGFRVRLARAPGNKGNMNPRTSTHARAEASPDPSRTRVGAGLWCRVGAPVATAGDDSPPQGARCIPSAASARFTPCLQDQHRVSGSYILDSDPAAGGDPQRAAGHGRDADHGRREPHLRAAARPEPHACNPPPAHVLQ